MYIFEEMIDEFGWEDGKPQWKSDKHRAVAVTVCICNPHIRSRDTLMHNVSIINSISDENIVKVTFEDLEKMGVAL